MPDPASFDAIVASLESQRATLGGAAVDFAIQALRDKLGEQEPAKPTRKLRQVSIMFCDIVGSTAMLQPLSAEDTLEVLDAALARFEAIVQAEGGRVLRFTGDGLKAAFGSERAREDDAVRAVRAGLAILRAGNEHGQRVRDEYRIPSFEVRVGINTGPVSLGGGVEADRTMMGHAVHVAARLEQAASPGQLCISHSTWLPVRGQFDVVELPPVSVKGADGPQRIYRVLAERPDKASAGRSLSTGRMTPLIGRDDELTALVDRVRHSFDTARVCLALVVGDAGIGKTRLVGEFEGTLGRHAARAIRARVHAAGEMQPYGLLRDLVANWLQIANNASIDIARDKLVGGVAALGHAGATEEDAHLIGRLIGIDFPGDAALARLEGSRLRDRAFQALRATLRRLAAQRPLLILADDLHWADDGSLDFLQTLVESDDAVPLAIVATARPALRERRPAWFDPESPHWQAELQPLASDQARDLVGALLGRLPFDRPELIGLLVDRAAGNPYFLEELVHMLVDDDVAGMQETSVPAASTSTRQPRIPETLVGVLQARLDALPAPSLAALQQASIIGPVFWATALPAAAVDAFAELERRGLVHQRAESAFDGAAEYAFHHPLLHEVTYATVLKAQRREGHARIAAWLSERLAGREGEFLYATGLHYEQAGDGVHAFDCFERATLDAFRRHAHAPALAAIERALSQPIVIEAERRFQLLARRQAVADRIGDARLSHDTMADMERLAEANDSDAQRAKVLVTQALQADREGSPSDAARLAERAAHLADITGTAQSACLAYGELAWLAVMSGDHAAAERHLQAAWPWARRTAALPPQSWGSAIYLEQLAFIQVESLVAQRRLTEAAAVLDELEPTSRGIERLSLLARRNMIAQQLADTAGLQARAEEMLELARRLEIPRYVGSAMSALAWAAALRGDVHTQLALAIDIAELGAKIGYRTTVSEALELEGAARLVLGDVARARARLVEAEASFREQGHVLSALAILTRLADLECAAGDMASALKHVDTVVTDPLVGDLPIACLLRCWNVLNSSEDARAEAFMTTRHGDLQQLLSHLPDDASRRRFMATLPHLRAFEEALTVAGLALLPA